MNKLNTLSKTLWLMLSFVFLSCNGTMYEEINNVFIPMSIEGKVIEVIYYKGGNTTLKIQTESKKIDYIGLDDRYKELVKEGDYFKKKANSNKCLLKKGDSVLLLDCARIESLTSIVGDSIVRGIDKWDRAVVKKWQRINDIQSIKELME